MCHLPCRYQCFSVHETIHKLNASKIYIYIYTTTTTLVFQLAMKLPGSRMDIVRTPNVSGPSPVGGSKGGTESRTISTLDAYELQAGHYNLACAYARIDADAASTTSSSSTATTTTSSDNIQMSIQNLRKAFEFGFTNYNFVKTDIDLTNITSTPEYINLMNEYEGKKKKKKNGIKFW